MVGAQAARPAVAAHEHEAAVAALFVASEDEPFEVVPPLRVLATVRRDRGARWTESRARDVSHLRLLTRTAGEAAAREEPRRRAPYALLRLTLALLALQPA